MASKLNLYVEEPFDISTQVQEVDLFTGLDGSTSTFTLTNKTNLEMGAKIQADDVEYYFYNYGYTKSGTYDFTTSSPPLTGSTLIVPGTIAFTVAAYDQTDIDGNATSNVQEQYFYIGNPDDIATTKFIADPSKSGISLEFRDLVGYGVTSGMFEIACATPDAAGTALTYTSGEVQLDSDFTAFTTVCTATTASSNTVITVASSSDASTFTEGHYLVLDKGGAAEETTKLLSISGDQLTVTKTDYDHAPGETIYSAAIKMWCRYTVPVNFTSQTAINYFNVVLTVIGAAEAR